MTTQSRRQQFIEKANQVHGDVYDYSKVVFVNVHIPVIIRCSVHGEFNQRPVKHTSQKCGCPKCGREKANKSKTLPKDTFIENARRVHGDTYTYEKVKYNNNHTPVVITCPIHGDFQQMPVKHTSQKCGCPRCSFTTSTADFIAKARQVHNNIYNYDKSIFETSHKKTVVTCYKHGDFLITPNNHMQGWGCHQCGIENNKGGYCESTLNGTILGASLECYILWK